MEASGLAGNSGGWGGGRGKHAKQLEQRALHGVDGRGVWAGLWQPWRAADGMGVMGATEGVG